MPTTLGQLPVTSEKKSSTKAILSDVRYCIWSHQDMVYVATYMPTNLLDGDFLPSGSLLSIRSIMFTWTNRER